jgi:hypothetical protein
MTAQPCAERRGAPPRRTWARAVGVAVVALGVFGWDLAGERHFVDESAFIAQSYFADLLWRGQRDSAFWLEYPAVDLPPLPKYLIGLALHLAGERSPGREAAFRWSAAWRSSPSGPWPPIAASDWWPPCS